MEEDKGTFTSLMTGVGWYISPEEFLRIGRETAFRFAWEEPPQGCHWKGGKATCPLAYAPFD